MPSLFAVHLADGVLSNPAWVGGYLAAGVLVGFSMWRVREEEIPRIGVMTAAFFVASQIHIPLGVTSAHLLLNGLVGVLLGRRAAVAIVVGLFLQSFLFAHGGLTALGVNVTVYALPAVIAGMLFRPVRRLGWLSDFALGLLFGGTTAIVTVVLNYLILLFAGVEDWQALAWIVLVSHLPIIVVEAIGVGFVVRHLGKVKPEWLA
jgi:cobalt/nickel transport system permease protein